MSAFVYRLARLSAWLGAAVLCALAVISVVSITGRALSGYGYGPVPGDFELVEAGTALAVFCFLPWCHLQRGHAVVDLFWGLYPAPLKRVLLLLWDLVLLAAWALLVWRMGVALEDYRANGEVTFILQFPVWWGYAASMVPALLGCFTGLWRVLEGLGLAQPPVGFGQAGSVH
jgi:TRAP-type C4-dicarboxylate transport system permease small subunit